MERTSDSDPLPPLTPFDAATMIQSLDERGCGLRVAFFKPAAAPDRYGHVIATIENAGQADEKIVVRLSSCEGLGRDGWPASPPLQSLSIEDRPAGAVALLVGMSGQSHWSASVEAASGNRRLIFDIACRLAMGVPEWYLGSKYLTEPTWQGLTMRFGPEISMKTLPSGFCLEAKATSGRPIRWKYEVELEDVTRTL